MRLSDGKCVCIPNDAQILSPLLLRDPESEVSVTSYKKRPLHLLKHKRLH